MDFTSVPGILAIIAGIIAVVYLLRGGDTLLGVAVLLLAIAVAVAGFA